MAVPPFPKGLYQVRHPEAETVGSAGHVVGKDKAEAVKKCITGPITPVVQASILQLHPDVTFVCDAEAYSLLEA